MEKNSNNATVEISKNSKGEYSFSVKVVDDDDANARKRAYELADELTKDCSQLEDLNRQI